MSYFHVLLLLGASVLSDAAPPPPPPPAELPGDLFDSDEEYDQPQLVSLLQTSISLVMKDSRRNSWGFEDIPTADEQAHVGVSSPFICGFEPEGFNASWLSELELNYSWPLPSELELNYSRPAELTEEVPELRVEALCDVLGEACDDELDESVAYTDVASIQLSAQAYSL